MYCQKCGRKLKAGMRFCDYCGSPVDGSDRRGNYGSDRNNYQSRRNQSMTPPKRESAETIKRRAQIERTRKKREQERLRARKSRRNAILAIFLALIAAVLLAWVSNGWMSNELEKDENKLESVDTKKKASDDQDEVDSENVDDEETEIVDDSDSEADDSETQDDETEDNDNKQENKKGQYAQIAKKCDKYTDDRMDDISGAYPKEFEVTDTSNTNAIEAFTDPEGDGNIVYYAKQEGTSAKGESLLSKYTSGLDADILDEDSDNDWYMVTYERNDKVNHRMAVLVDGLCVYYEFSYPSDSEYADSYDEYIEYMDYYLMEELASATEENETNE